MTHFGTIFRPRRLALLAALALTLSPRPASALIRVQLDGEMLQFSGAQPTQLSGRTVVPMRTIFEALGADIKWDALTQGITATRGDTVIRMQIGNRIAYVGDKEIRLDQPPVLLSGSTMVPLRFVGEALGAEVGWNDAQQLVILTSGSGGTAPPSSVRAPLLGTVLSVDGARRAVVVRPAEQGAADASVTVAADALLQRSIGPVPVEGDPVYGMTGKLPTLDAAVPGEEATLTFNAAGEAVAYHARALVGLSRVRSANATRVVLADAMNTSLTLGPTLTYVNADEAVRPAFDCREGDRIALFIAPSARRIYRVSRSNADIQYAGGASLPTGGRPQLDSVRHDATRALRAGDRLTVVAKGTAGNTARFDIGDVKGLAMTENPAGTYTGVYQVRAADAVVDGRPMVHLISADRQELIVQSDTPVTFDNTPPRIVGTFPARGSALDLKRPNLSVYAEDLGGAGLADGTFEITSGGRVTKVDGTLTPPTSVSAVPTVDLNGPVSVKATLRDAAGNATSVTFAFTVGALQGSIVKVNHNATGPVAPGTTVIVAMVGTTGLTAVYSLLDEQNREVVSNVPMPEAVKGTYRGNFVPTAELAGLQLRAVGKLRGLDGKQTTASAPQPITIAAAPATTPTVTSPKNKDAVTPQLVVKGTAAPNALVEVAVQVQGTKAILVLLQEQYRQDLGTKQVHADEKGAWTSPAITLPKPAGVSNLRYLITVTQTNAAGNKSAATTLTVTPK